MSKEASLKILNKIEDVLNSSKMSSEIKGLGDHYNRDIQFIKTAKQCLQFGNKQEIQFLINQTRNLSQGFGSYSENLPLLDKMIDSLFEELQDYLLKIIQKVSVPHSMNL